MNAVSFLFSSFFFFLAVLFYSTLSDILALWSLESKGKHGEATPRGRTGAMINGQPGCFRTG